MGKQSNLFEKVTQIFSCKLKSNLRSLSVGHSESRRMTDELGSRQRDLSTSSVTKRANGHWHAIIASSCRWSQREYKRQPVHRINHPFASESSGGASLLLFLSLRVRSLSECGRYGTAAVVAVSRENNGLWRQSHQECAVASSPACFSTKEQIYLLTRVTASL